MRRILLASFVVVAVLGVVWWVRHAGPPSRSYDTVMLPSLGAELLYLDAKEIVRRGPSRVVVLRFAEPVEFRPYHFKEDASRTPMTVEAWAEVLRAPVVFNAGQFDENMNYLGWLKRDNAWLSPQRKEPWKGLLVSGPLDGAVWGRVVDLDIAQPQVVDRYKHAVQSMMLVDAESRVRVRDSELTACRTVVAEDAQGRVMVILTEGATTLGDLARWLPTTPLGIVRAMNMDGGIESQLALRTPELTTAVYGQYGTGTTVWNSGGGQIKYPLPAVVGVFPVERPNVAREP